MSRESLLDPSYIELTEGGSKSSMTLSAKASYVPDDFPNEECLTKHELVSNIGIFE